MCAKIVHALAGFEASSLKQLVGDGGDSVPGPVGTLIMYRIQLQERESKKMPKIMIVLLHKT